LPLAEILPISDVTESENLQRRQSLSKPLHLAGQEQQQNGRFGYARGRGTCHIFAGEKIGENPDKRVQISWQGEQNEKLFLQLIFCTQKSLGIHFIISF